MLSRQIRALEQDRGASPFIRDRHDVALTSQGTLAERLRAGGTGIPAFHIPAGVGTQVADGGLPWRSGPDGSVAVAFPPKETREFHGRTYVLEEAITTDFTLVRAARGDRHGNLDHAGSKAGFEPVRSSLPIPCADAPRSSTHGCAHPPTPVR